MKLLGFLCCLAGLFVGFPAWLNWMHVVLSMAQVAPANVPAFMQQFAGTAEPIFTQFGLGAVLFGIGFLAMLLFR